MADTKPLAPTDAELDELRQANSGRLNFVTLREFRTIARAVLAKWGAQPAVAGEQVDRADAVNLARNTLTQHDRAITKKGVRVLAEAVLSMDAVLTTPQPTQPQAGAVPLTDEQRNAIYDKHCFLGDNGWEIDWWKVIDEVEAAHGIKGGQHGTK